MFKVRYITPKQKPPDFSQSDRERLKLAMESQRMPGFGQSPEHPGTVPARIGLEYSDKYRGDRK